MNKIIQVGRVLRSGETYYYKCKCSEIKPNKRKEEVKGKSDG